MSSLDLRGRAEKTGYSQRVSRSQAIRYGIRGSVSGVAKVEFPTTKSTSCRRIFCFSGFLANIWRTHCIVLDVIEYARQQVINRVSMSCVGNYYVPNTYNVLLCTVGTSIYAVYNRYNFTVYSSYNYLHCQQLVQLSTLTTVVQLSTLSTVVQLSTLSTIGATIYTVNSRYNYLHCPQ